MYANSERNLYETWAKIKSLYDELSGTPGYSSRTLNRARRMQYAPPLAWDGLDIDHPAAMPNMSANDPIEAGVDEVLLERIIAGRHHGEIPRAERLAVLDYAIKNELGKLDVARILRLNDAAACQALVRRRRELRQESA
ncbi:hypothetical protein [Nocardia brasiliensis]|uniref:hypothetical protein n=1 Tax=Nocardia brasiliensis TaxID=37326 RepID=UPI0024541F09|nr:hypothetical protein [Nocardia brasiliensis]